MLECRSRIQGIKHSLEQQLTFPQGREPVRQALLKCMRILSPGMAGGGPNTPPVDAQGPGGRPRYLLSPLRTRPAGSKSLPHFNFMYRVADRGPLS